MSRAVKFRAWDSYCNRWRDDYAINPETGKPHWLHKDGPNYYYQDEATQLVLVQFTGLKDKNGKEICEGDIVKQMFPDWDWNDDGPEKRWKEKVSKIIFRGHGFWVEDEGFGWEGEDLWNWEIMEVIGNIYENPELNS